MDEHQSPNQPLCQEPSCWRVLRAGGTRTKFSARRIPLPAKPAADSLPRDLGPRTRWHRCSCPAGWPGCWPRSGHSRSQSSVCRDRAFPTAGGSLSSFGLDYGKALACATLAGPTSRNRPLPRDGSTAALAGRSPIVNLKAGDLAGVAVARCDDPSTAGPAGRSAPARQLRPQPARLILRWRPAPQTPVAAMGMTGSIVLANDDPAALARFDGALLEDEPQPGQPPQPLAAAPPGQGRLAEGARAIATPGSPRP